MSNDCRYDNRVQKTVELLCSERANVFLNTVHKVNDDKVVSTEIYNGDFLTIRSKLWNPNKAIDKILKIIPKRSRKIIKNNILKYYRYFSYYMIWKNEDYPNDIDLIIANDLITLPVSSFMKRKYPNSKVIYDSHEFELYRNPPLTLLNKAFVYLLERYNLKYCEVIITCSNYISNELQRIYKHESIFNIYNSPRITREHISKANIRDYIKLGSDDILLLHVGKLTYGRGLNIIIEYLQKISNIHLVNLGGWDNTYKSTIDQQIKKLGLKERVHFLQPVHPTKVVEFIEGADIGLISIEAVTKSYEYSMPNKLFELSFAKIPIIVNKNLKCADIVTDFELGICFDLYNFTSFKQAINHIIRNKRKFYPEVKFSQFNNIYSWDAQRKNYLKLLGEIGLIKY